MSRTDEEKRPVLLLATRNRHKVKEMGDILFQLHGWNDKAQKKNPRLTSLLDFPGVVPPEETGDSYGKNAEAKARAATEATGHVTLADDSGLEVEALSGAPGIHSARWLGEISQADRNRRILQALKDRPPEARRARFRCAVAVCRPSSGRKAATVRIFHAALAGAIAQEESGGHGFGYDPIFVPDVNGRAGRRTLAQFSPSEKNRTSHRARALRLAADFLASLLWEPPILK
ncbi:MAG: non-canonical purine NTP pyrophosphatase [Nitrospinota bacterium]